MLGKRKRKTYPSQERYDEGHPVVAIRITQEVRKKLESIREKLGVSWVDIVLGSVEPMQGLIEENEEQLQEAHNRGWAEAREKYRVTFPCCVCGKPTEIDDPESKQVVASYLAKRLCHEECFPNRGR